MPERSASQMLRRFEIYSVRPEVPDSTLDEMKKAFLRCGRHIPELLYCAVGMNLSSAPVNIIWEHAYESPEAYQRYMIHPYHANILDRYLLSDCPESITMRSDLADAGLLGYACNEPTFYMSSGIRRLVLLGVRANIPTETVRLLEEELRKAPDHIPQLTLSVVGENTMGSAWFDGVTPVGPPSMWTHCWEQGFETLEDMESYLEGDTSLAQVERTGWHDYMGNIVERSVDFYYHIEPGE